MPTPIQTFKDNIRPAKLMLEIYLLLDTNDHLVSDGVLVGQMRKIVQADAQEDLLLVYNELFLGLVRERAGIQRSSFRRATLQHLLRQAVVASCTGLDTYLPALMRTHLPTVIRTVGRDFVPRDDDGVSIYLSELTFSLDDTMRLINDPNAAEFISAKIMGLVNYSYLSSRKGVHITGRLLGLSRPWEMISQSLGRENKELKKILDDTVERRNNIIHRADRSQDDPDGQQDEISYVWAKQSVDTMEHICLALDELVTIRMQELQALSSEQLTS